MNTDTQHKEYMKGLKLIAEAFDILREPLELDEKPEIWREEAQVGLHIIKARDKLRSIVSSHDQQKRGVKTCHARTDLPTMCALLRKDA